MSDLRNRAQEIGAEYWSAREEITERVAVAQMALALARAEIGQHELAALLEAGAAVRPAAPNAAETPGPASNEEEICSSPDCLTD